MQADLHALIVAVLQRHPELNYFQGFHDIMTVLYLTFLDRTPRRGSVEEGKRDTVDEKAEAVDEKADVVEVVEEKGEVDEKAEVVDEKVPEVDEQRFEVDEEGQRQWDELLAAAEVVSLCRVRDAMGTSLGPMMGMLR